MKKKIMCTEECLSGRYKRKRPCCNTCDHNESCGKKCKETIELCGCVRLIN